jgi:hypothetical protein
MATFRRGLDAEDRICTKLEGFGCRIQRDQRLDHKHKLDFVITNYIDNPNFYSLGVQITTKLDLFEKQEEFLRANQSSRVTTKALYLELSEKIDLDDGGALGVLAVILEFQFNRSYANIKIAAARIYDDLTYQFYDLAARVKQLRERVEEHQWKLEVASSQSATAKFAGREKPAVGSATPGLAIVASTNSPAMPAAANATAAPRENLTGMIDSYVRQGGHGVIQGEGESKYFFHISHVSDDALRDQLNAIPYSTNPARLYVAVEFWNAGFTKPGARYPEAHNVRARR